MVQPSKEPFNFSNFTVPIFSCNLHCPGFNFRYRIWILTLIHILARVYGKIVEFNGIKHDTSAKIL
jgi:hypothetical protein